MATVKEDLTIVETLLEIKAVLVAVLEELREQNKGNK